MYYLLHFFHSSSSILLKCICPKLSAKANSHGGAIPSRIGYRFGREDYGATN